MADPRLRQAIEAKDFILAPGVFDLISALIADRAGFKALYVTGYGTVASYLGLPDAGHRHLPRHDRAHRSDRQDDQHTGDR
jgi:2-methylisocitrate lyase-like PEP mutase family enzyme